MQMFGANLSQRTLLSPRALILPSMLQDAFDVRQHHAALFALGH